jgi:hypothetical protein
MEEDGDGLCCRACIIEVLDDHEKSVANNPVLKKLKCLVSEDEFKEILSYNEVMQHIEKDNNDGETIWKYKRIFGHEVPLNHRGKETSTMSRLNGRMGRSATSLYTQLQQMIL